MTEFKRILLATNFDDASSAAVETAVGLARAAGESIHVLCVLEALMYAPPEMAQWAERDPQTHPEVTRKLQDVLRAIRARGVETIDGAIEYGIAVDVILRHANGGHFNLVVVGNHGRGGNLGAYVTARTKVPVVAVPANNRGSELKAGAGAA